MRKSEPQFVEATRRQDYMHQSAQLQFSFRSRSSYSRIRGFGKRRISGLPETDPDSTGEKRSHPYASSTGVLSCAFEPQNRNFSRPTPVGRDAFDSPEFFPVHVGTSGMPLVCHCCARFDPIRAQAYKKRCHLSVQQIHRVQHNIVESPRQHDLSSPMTHRWRDRTLRGTGIGRGEISSPETALFVYSP